MQGFGSCCSEARSVCVSSPPNRVTRTFWKIGPPLFSSSGNQRFRYTVRFTSTLSFEYSCLRPIYLVPYRFPVLQPFCTIAFGYYSFRVRSVVCGVNFVCISSLFPSISSHRPNFPHFRTVLFSNSESVHKKAITFAYELRFQRSIYQNRSEKNFGSALGGFENFKISKFASKD